MEIQQADLDDLRARLTRTRWPDQLPGVGWDYGIPLEYVQELAEYWRTGYDWRVHELRLNGFDQFTTTIDGQRVHFLHVRSAQPSAMPLVITHGWPGSIAEFTEIIGPLTDPAAHGGDPEDAFHLVMPSIPGFGFSGPTHDTGWNVRRIARAWDELMRRLGYHRYGAQGGDWGSAISRELGLVAPDHLIGVHLNMLIAQLPEGVTIDGLTDEEKARLRTRVRRPSPQCPPASRSSPMRSRHLSAGSPSGPTTSCTGPNSTRGGHFAAMERPGLLTADIRDFFRQLRRPATAGRGITL